MSFGREWSPAELEDSAVLKEARGISRGLGMLWRHFSQRAGMERINLESDCLAAVQSTNLPMERVTGSEAYIGTILEIKDWKRRWKEKGVELVFNYVPGRKN
eukprot:Filipodium_phascolosomae@DN3665_c0_g1_i1.p1